MVSERVKIVDSRIQWSKQPEQPASDQVAYGHFSEFVQEHGFDQPMQRAIYMAAVLGLMLEGRKSSAIENYLQKKHGMSQNSTQEAIMLADTYIEDWLATSDEPRFIPEPELLGITNVAPHEDVQSKKMTVNSLREKYAVYNNSLDDLLKGSCEDVDLLEELRQMLTLLVTTSGHDKEYKLSGDEIKHLKVLLGRHYERKNTGLYTIIERPPKSLHEIRSSVVRGKGSPNLAESALVSGLDKLLVFSQARKSEATREIDE